MTQTATVPVDAKMTRAMWKIALAAILATLLVLGAVAGGYAIYHNKTNQISDLKAEGQQLRATVATLRTQMKATQLKLGRTSSKLTVSTKRLTRAKAT